MFPNKAFGYHKITVERPLRLKDIDPRKAYSSKEIKELVEKGMADENGAPVIRKIHKSIKPDPLHGLFETVISKKKCVVEYQPDTNLRDTEQVPLPEEGGIEAFFKREVLPYVPDAWIDESRTQIGYEISFTRYFYKPTQMRILDEITADIRAIEKEADGLLNDIVGEGEL
jgi:type I restriction enzyme M protein